MRFFLPALVTGMISRKGVLGMKRSGYIKRSPIVRKRKYRKSEETIGKLGRVRLRGKKLEQLRRDCFERDGYRCMCGCKQPVTWEDGDMAHIVSRGAGG